MELDILQIKAVALLAGCLGSENVELSSESVMTLYYQGDSRQDGEDLYIELNLPKKRARVHASADILEVVVMGIAAYAKEGGFETSIERFDRKKEAIEVLLNRLNE